MAGIVGVAPGVVENPVGGTYGVPIGVKRNGVKYLITL